MSLLGTEKLNAAKIVIVYDDCRQQINRAMFETSRHFIDDRWRAMFQGQELRTDSIFAAMTVINVIRIKT